MLFQVGNPAFLQSLIISCQSLISCYFKPYKWNCRAWNNNRQMKQFPELWLQGAKQLWHLITWGRNDFDIKWLGGRNGFGRIDLGLINLGTNWLGDKLTWGLNDLYSMEGDCGQNCNIPCAVLCLISYIISYPEM
jgi:hypothetical protein